MLGVGWMWLRKETGYGIHGINNGSRRRHILSFRVKRLFCVNKKILQFFFTRQKVSFKLMAVVVSVRWDVPRLRQRYRCHVSRAWPPQTATLASFPKRRNPKYPHPSSTRLLHRQPAPFLPSPSPWLPSRPRRSRRISLLN